jgi:D-glycero-D-manno-heptose 1,7-bisphosphate phosphatase
VSELQDGRLGADGVWRDVAAARRTTRGRPALFLDRDGVVVDYVAFLHRPEEVSLIDGIARLIGAARQAGAPVVVVTNQSGVGRGYYGWDDFAAVQDEIRARLAALGAGLDAVFACPFHGDAKPPYRHGDHPARKPNPGMLVSAAELLGTDLPRSWMIGDRALDVMAARNAGLAGGLLLAKDDTADEAREALSLARQGFAVARIGHLDEARRHIDWLA